MRRALLVALLSAILLAGVGSWSEPLVCTDPCGADENGDCEIPGCPACVSLAVVPIPPETPELPGRPDDVGAAPLPPSRPPTAPPPAEIPHVPKRHLG